MPTVTAMDNPSRRRFLTGTKTVAPIAIRPPWTDQDRIAQNCTRCGDCITACPEKVLVVDGAGFPTFDPNNSREGCTFCKACASVCTFDVFDLTQAQPWTTKVAIDVSTCLPTAGVHCESCRDACLADAIRLRPRIGGPAIPAFDLDACTGCGACVPVCPVDALTVSALSTPSEHHP